MSMVITVLTLILFASAAVCGILAVTMAVMTVFGAPKKHSAGKKYASEEDDLVQVYFRKPLAKVETGAVAKKVNVEAAEAVKKKAVPAETKTDIIEDRLAGLPTGYHILTDIELTLPAAVKYKGGELECGKIDFLIIGPKRIFIIKVAALNRPNFKKVTVETDADAHLVASFLAQKLEKDFRVCGWVVTNGPVPKTKYPAAVIKKDDLIEAIIKYERTSPGKSKLKASNSVPEIISELKLAKWETSETNDITAADQPVFA